MRIQIVLDSRRLTSGNGRCKEQKCKEYVHSQQVPNKGKLHNEQSVKSPTYCSWFIVTTNLV